MARTIPSTPPKDTPAIELRIFDDFARNLPADWLVIHRPHWVGRARPGEPLLDGQAAFLIAHPEKGLLTLTLQTGGLQYEPSSHHWHTTDAAGKQRSVADPFAAAQSAARLVIAQLANHPAAMPGNPAFGHGVLLPDVLMPTRGLAAHAPAEIALDRSAAGDWAQKATTLLDAWQKKQPASGNAASRNWFRALEDLFLQPREARVLLRHRIADEQADMIALSPQQMLVLDMLARVRRQAVYGPAGTGKTLLAMQKARLLARQGQRVLLTCYNKALGQYLRAAMADEPNITAIHFHELCYELAGLDANVLRAPVQTLDKSRFFDQELAQRLIAGCAEKGPQFDALVVDEAQDFLPLWWQALDTCLFDAPRAVIYRFFDDAQRLRADAAPVEGAESALVLTTNWRNTRHIHEYLAKIQPSVDVTHSLSPPGSPVEMEPLRPNLPRALRRVLHRLCGEGGVAPEDIVILSGRSPNRSHVSEIEPELAPYRLTLTDDAGSVRLRGIQAFKGMEAPVIILTELDHMPKTKARQLHYIGASRATNLLVVLEDAVAK